MEKEKNQVLEFIRQRCENNLKTLIQFELPEFEPIVVPNFSKSEFLECDKRAMRLIAAINATNLEIANKLDQFERMQNLAQICLKLSSLDD